MIPRSLRLPPHPPCMDAPVARDSENPSIDEAARPSLSQVWQLPLLLVSVILFGAGLYLARPGDPTPQYAATLGRIGQLIDAGQYDNAIKALGEIEQAVPMLPLPMQGEFYAHIADSHYLQQKSKGWSVEANHKKIVAGYNEAKKRKIKLDASQKERLAATLAALGRQEQALAVLGELGEAGYVGRQDLIKKMIQSAMTASPRRVNEAEHLIQTLESEPGLTTANAAWAVARQSQILLDRDEVDRAIELLLRRIRLMTLDDANAPLGELAVQLGKAYLVDGDPSTAERWLLRAKQSLALEDDLNAAVLLALGDIRFAEGNIVEALEHYGTITRQFEASPRYHDALVGKAEAEARLQSFDRALVDYENAVKLYTGPKGATGAQHDRLLNSLATQHELRFGEGHYAAALRFLKLETRLQKPPLPSNLILRLAQTHEQLARAALGLADGEEDTRESWAAVTDPKKRKRAAEHYAQAADYYLSHARAVTIQSDEAYGESLWRAGEYYDRSGLYKRAIDVFAEYREGRPEDPLAMTATLRLGRSYQASGRFDEAIVLFKQLVEEHPKSPEAYQSLVPLASSYINTTPPRIDAAEQVLRSVVEDHPALRPESNEYREALIALGQLYYRRGGEGDYGRAIERINEAVSRYGTDLRIPELRFQLGDSYRKSVEQITAKLESGQLPPSKRMALRAERARRLDEAQQHFGAVIDAFERPGQSALGELEQLYLRNSYFYRADCAYDLGRFEGTDGAIALYEKALQKYGRDPAALVALIQIVNAYSELGQHAKAKVVNERAKVLLKQIPEEMFDDPNLPMSRYHWQRWLDWTSQLSSADNDAGGVAP